MSGAEAGGADPIEASAGSALVVAPIGGGLSWELERRGAGRRACGVESRSALPFAAWSTMCGEPLPPDLRVAADLVVDHLAGHRLAVDDAEWLDAPEVDLLVAIIPRIEVVVGCHVGTDRGRAVAARLARLLRVHTLAPVDRAVVEHVVRSYGSLGDADAHDSTIARSGDLPGVARSLASGEPLAAARVDQFRHVLAELDVAARDWIRDVAALPEHWPVADAGEPPASARDRMLVGADGRPAPGLLVELAATDLSPVDIDDRRAAIASQCADPVRAARLLRLAARPEHSRATARHALAIVDAEWSHPDLARLAALAAESPADRRAAVTALLACELGSEIADLVPGTTDAALDAGIARQLDLADRADRVAGLPADATEAVRTLEWLQATPSAESALAHPSVADTSDDLDAVRWRWQRSIARAVIGSARLDALIAPPPREPSTSDAWHTTVAQLAALSAAHRDGPTDAVLDALAPTDVHPSLPRALVDAHRAVLLADLGRSTDAVALVAAGPRSSAPIDRALHQWAAAEVELGAGHPLKALRIATDAARLDAPPAWFATLAGAWGAWEVGEALPQLTTRDPGAALFALVSEELSALRAFADGRQGAVAGFEAAAEAWSGCHRRGELRARWAAAEAARRHGDRDRAVEGLLALEARVEACAMAPLLQRVRRSLRLAGVQRRGARRSNEGPLSQREAEVIELVGKGLATRDIALRLGLAESTVETQVTAAMHKLGARTRLQAATKYRELQR